MRAHDERGSAPLDRGRVHVGDHVVAADEVEGDVRAAAGRFDDRPRRARRRRARRRRCGPVRCRRRVREPGNVRACRRCAPCRRRCAPNACASCSAAVPTPEPIACTSTHSPAATCACVTIASCTVTNTSGTPPIATRSRSVGDDRAVRGGDRDVLGLRAAAGDAEDAIADRTRRHVRADRVDDLAREFHAGNVGRDNRAAAGNDPRVAADRRGSIPRRAPGPRTPSGAGSGTGRSATSRWPSTIVIARTSQQPSGLQGRPGPGATVEAWPLGS